MSTTELREQAARLIWHADRARAIADGHDRDAKELIRRAEALEHPNAGES